jgi:LEA14-like dessication related protein
LVSLRSLLLLVLLSSCASLGRPSFARPDVELQQIALVDLTTSGATLELLLAIENPNVFAIHGRRLEVTLDLEDTRFGDITREASFRLAGQDTTMITVPMRFTWAGVGAAARSIVTTGEVAYALEGAVDLETPYGNGRVPYRQSGSIPLVDAVASVLQGARTSHP